MDYSFYQSQSPARWCIRLAQAGLGLILWIARLLYASSLLPAMHRRRNVMPTTNDKTNPPVNPVAIPSPATSVKLTAADRCDSCGAQARSRVVLPSGRDLLFCGHHLIKNSTELALEGAVVTDSLEALFAAPA